MKALEAGALARVRIASAMWHPVRRVVRETAVVR